MRSPENSNKPMAGAHRRSYPVLEKKLQELESLLRSAATDPTEISQRIDFLHSLVIAESEFNPENSPEHLQHISHRLSSLEASFLNWTEFGAAPDDEGLDAQSTCSCTHSCLNEGGEDDDDNDDESNRMLDPDPFDPADNGILGPQGKQKGEEEAGRECEKKRKLGRRSICVVGAVLTVAASAVAAMASVMMLSSGEDDDFLVPT